jgi:hypothetical protein
MSTKARRIVRQNLPDVNVELGLLSHPNQGAQEGYLGGYCDRLFCILCEGKQAA